MPTPGSIGIGSKSGSPSSSRRRRRRRENFRKVTLGILLALHRATSEIWGGCGLNRAPFCRCSCSGTAHVDERIPDSSSTGHRDGVVFGGPAVVLSREH